MSNSISSISSDDGVWPLAGICDDYLTSYYLDNEISLLLKHNDPNITSVIIDYKGICDINLEDIYLDNNTHLKEIEIEELPYTTNDDFDNFNTEFCNFLSAIARSRSIEKLYIGHINKRHTGVNPLEVIQSLSPLFSANLRDVEFEFFITEREAELLASTLSNSTNKCLTKISLHLFRVSDKTSAKIYTALADYKLTKLHVRGKVGRRKSYTAICKLLNKRPTTLKKLLLFHVQPDDECIEILSNTLIDNSTLECLNLEDTTITKDGMLLLAKALQMNPQSALREIDLSGFSVKDDDDTAQVMTDALACIPGLKTINVNSLTPFIDIIQRPNTSLENFYMYNDDRSGADLGSSLDSALANSTTLKTISLQQGRFSTESANVLGESLYSNNTLKYLDLGYTESIDWGSIFPALSSQESSLEILRLQEAGVKDDDLSLLANVFATNRSLKELYLDGNDMISKDGWLDFFSRLQSNTLEKLRLNQNNIDDEVVPSIVSALRSKCPSLKKLELECYEITLVGWMALSTLLTCPTLNLEYLVIGGCRSRDDDDDVLITFANALVNNTSLKMLHMPTSSITERGWDALSNVLCNKTTIDATSSSNHTLQIISQDYCHYEHQLPKDIRSLVRFNRAEDTVAARRKIIRSHFSNNGMQLFIDDNDIDAGVMPHILAWIGRDFFGHDLLFRVVKSMPSLFG